MKKPALDARLRAAAAYVRQDAVFADVGTDHAYLPLFLLAEGRISRAVLSDINEGPLERAREHAAAYPYFASLSFHLTNGLCGLEGLGITDIAICGMGGELIAEILSAAPFVRDASVRLILQPMSRPAKLRAYLAAEGFEILSETYVSAAGKHYACMCVCYSGVPYALSLFEQEFGKAPDISNASFLSYLNGKERSLSLAVRGLESGGGTAPEQRALLSEIEAFKKKLMEV